MKTLLATLMLLVLTSPVLEAGTNSVNFVRYTETTRNGILTDATLVFFPETFGQKDQGFKTYVVTGHADASPRVPIESRAKHNAISRLLVTHGLKYLEGKQLLRDTNYSDTIIVIYEGFVTIPPVVKSYRYLDDGKTLEGVFNLTFCPAKRQSKSIFQHIRQLATNIGDSVAIFFAQPIFFGHFNPFLTFASDTLAPPVSTTVQTQPLPGSGNIYCVFNNAARCLLSPENCCVNHHRQQMSYEERPVATTQQCQRQPPPALEILMPHAVGPLFAYFLSAHKK